MFFSHNNGVRYYSFDIFPRAVKPADKAVLFRLYLGGLKFPEREIEFRTKDLTYQGKLEM